MKLTALKISNFGCIDAAGCEIEIDRIVIMIGPNNVGKSTILDAYEAFASTGAPQSQAKFRDASPRPPISIEAVFSEIGDGDREVLGAKWEYEDARLGKCIRVKWEWPAPEEKGVKSSWDPTANSWTKGGVGGWDTLIASRIPAPLRVRPTDDPITTEAQLVEILTAAVKSAIKADEGRAATVRDQLKTLSEEFAKEIESQLQEATGKVAERLGSVFQGYAVELVPDAGKFEPEKVIGAGSQIRIKGANDPLLPLSQQGSGVRRTFLWSAIGALADLGRLKQGKATLAADRQRILLIEEPEAFLHPPMVRAAREALYALSEVPAWQVLATTHSPVFIDVSKPHTTIVRVSRDSTSRTRVFSTERAAFSEEDRDNLRMIRACHPTVSEFFFADEVWLVEGETEHAVFTHLLQKCSLPSARGVHIVNCMGKANLVLFARILNQFGSSYTIIHDADAPQIQRNGTWQRSGMWTMNGKIQETLAAAPVDSAKRKVIVHVPDFEGYYFGYQLTVDKPYQAVHILGTAEFTAEAKYKALRDSVAEILNSTHASICGNTEQIATKVTGWVESAKPTPTEAWTLAVERGA